MTENNPLEIKDFDLAYAQEILARAYALSGIQKLAENHYQKAKELGQKNQAQEDQEIFQGDLNGGGWFGLN